MLDSLFKPLKIKNVRVNDSDTTALTRLTLNTQTPIKRRKKILISKIEYSSIASQRSLRWFSCRLNKNSVPEQWTCHHSNSSNRASSCARCICNRAYVQKTKWTILSDCQYLPQYFRFTRSKGVNQFQFIAHFNQNDHISPFTFELAFAFDWKCMWSLCVCECAQCNNIKNHGPWLSKQLFHYCIDVRRVFFSLTRATIANSVKFSYSYAYFQWWNLRNSVGAVLCLLFDCSKAHTTMMMRVQICCFDQHTLIFFESEIGSKWLHKVIIK